MSDTPEKPMLILVTGFSGAGLTTVINALQDLGLYCIDNIPVEMIVPTFKLLAQQDLGKLSGFGMGIHIHKNFDRKEFLRTINELQQITKLDVVCLKADDLVLARRFNSTRRPHPLIESELGLVEAIAIEKRFLQPLEEFSNLVIDTSSLNPHQLKRLIENRYENGKLGRTLNVNFISFGFKHGQYKPLDSMFDVRFLDNPYFVPALKEKTGKDKDIIDFIGKNEVTIEFLNRLVQWFEWLLPQYFAEGKHYFRVGIGCTGGKHRSVYIAEQLTKLINEKNIPHINAQVSHCDIDKP